MLETSICLRGEPVSKEEERGNQWFITYEFLVRLLDVFKAALLSGQHKAQPVLSD